MRKRIAACLIICLCLFLLAGCGSEGEKKYRQAVKELADGLYEYALEDYTQAIEAGVKLQRSWRGAGIANFYLGNYAAAIEDFTTALEFQKIDKKLKQDLLTYRISAYTKTEMYQNAMMDCQTLASEGLLDANGYFLTGVVALTMDAYGEASSNFDKAYVAEPGYDMAIRIYQAYLNEDMEADGTRYLEEALRTEPKTMDDYCDRGRIYYYMEDYESARRELIEAVNKNSTNALLVLGMVYLAQKDISNARSMYQQYVDQAGNSAAGYNGLAQCDIAEGDYAEALNHISLGLGIATPEEAQDLLTNQIVIYERQLDFVTARQLAEDYLAQYPGDEDMQRELTFLRSRTGQMG